MDVLNTVCKIARAEMRKTLKTRKVCAVATLNVQNAFNTVGYGRIKNKRDISIFSKDYKELFNEQVA